MDRLTNIGSNGEIYITDNDETRRLGQKEAAYAKLKRYEDIEINNNLQNQKLYKIAKNNGFNKQTHLLIGEINNLYELIKKLYLCPFTATYGVINYKDNAVEQQEKYLYDISKSIALSTIYLQQLKQLFKVYDGYISDVKNEIIEQNTSKEN